MKYAELFAGAGGLSLGLDRAGFSCAWHSEIAEFPRRVLKARWPDTPLYGDVATLNGYELVERHGPIDLLSGGSPCQDLSVAGKRKGMTEGSGTRSSLFYEQLRLWNETGAEFLLWENVDGARSSNDGKDFGSVLSAIVGAAVFVPTDGWRSGGVAVGPKAIAAWRVLDAQFFGVPQRRRRVFVLSSRTGRADPAEILSLSEGLRGDTAPSGEAWEGVTPGVGDGAETESCVAATLVSPGQQYNSFQNLPNLVLSFAQNQRGELRLSDVDTSLNQGGGKPGEGYPAVFAFKSGQSEAAGGTFVTENFAPTLQGQNNGSTAVPAVLAFHSVNDGSDNGADCSPTIRAHDPMAVVTHSLRAEGFDASEDGTGRGTPIVVNVGGFDGLSVDDPGAPVNTLTTELAHMNRGPVLLSAANHGVSNAATEGDRPESLPLLWEADGAEAVQRTARGCRCIHSTEVLRPEMHGGCIRCEAGKGDSAAEFASPFTEGGSPRPVPEMRQAQRARCASSRPQSNEQRTGESGTHLPELPSARTQQASEMLGSGLRADTSTERSLFHAQPTGKERQVVGIPRRLTPRECERLMGWPDNWTNVPDEKGKPASDANRYKACGNGVVSNCVQWIGERLIRAVA